MPVPYLSLAYSAFAEAEGYSVRNGVTLTDFHSALVRRTIRHATARNKGRRGSRDTRPNPFARVGGEALLAARRNDADSRRDDRSRQRRVLPVASCGSNSFRNSIRSLHPDCIQRAARPDPLVEPLRDAAYWRGRQERFGRLR